MVLPFCVVKNKTSRGRLALSKGVLGLEINEVIRG